MHKIGRVVTLAVGLMLLMGLVTGCGSAMTSASASKEAEVIKESVKVEFDNPEFIKVLEEFTNTRLTAVETSLRGGSLTVIQRLVEKGEVTVEELVLYYLKQIKDNDENYKSVICLNPLALDEARALDLKIRDKSANGSLIGAVALLKDNIGTLNMPTTAGADALKDLTTKRDAKAVVQLKEAGTIILGKANLSEWANFMSMTSSNGYSAVGGQTKNAQGDYDTGGSSSGSAVALAKGFCNIALGTETAGSVISPASQNGVIGFKPTHGSISGDLVIPIAEHMDSIGIMALSLADLNRVYGVLDTVPTGERSVAKDGTADKTDLQFGIIDDGSPETQVVKLHFEKMGTPFKMIPPPTEMADIDVLTMLAYSMKNDLQRFFDNPDVVSPVKSLTEVIDFNKTDLKKHAANGMDILEIVRDVVMEDEAYKQMVAHNKTGHAAILDKMLKDNDVDVIVSINNQLSWHYASAGYPAITLPFGKKESGEPFGATFVLPTNGDYELMQYLEGLQPQGKI